jgi:hypothetical protein
MSFRKLLRAFSLAGVFAGAMVLAASSVAQTAESLFLATNTAPVLNLTMQPGEFVGPGQVIRASLRSGTNEFLFVVPDGLHTTTPREGRMVMSSRDMTYHISIRLVEPRPATPELKEMLRAHIANQFDGLNSLEEFTTTIADREGTGFQLRQELRGLAPRQVKMLWVPFKAGVLEFTLNADSGTVSAAQGAFDLVLLTFRSNERGRVELVIRSDKT